MTPPKTPARPRTPSVRSPTSSPGLPQVTGNSYQTPDRPSAEQSIPPPAGARTSSAIAADISESLRHGYSLEALREALPSPDVPSSSRRELADWVIIPEHPTRSRPSTEGASFRSNLIPQETTRSIAGGNYSPPITGQSHQEHGFHGRALQPEEMTALASNSTHQALTSDSTADRHHLHGNNPPQRSRWRPPPPSPLSQSYTPNDSETPDRYGSRVVTPPHDSTNVPSSIHRAQGQTHRSAPDSSATTSISRNEKESDDSEGGGIRRRDHVKKTKEDGKGGFRGAGSGSKGSGRGEKEKKEH